jgi:hypothetical protein
MDEAPVALAMGAPDLLYDRLVAQVAAHGVDREAVGAQALDGLLELLRTARGHGQRVALLAEHAGDAQADAAGPSRHDRRALRHGHSSFSLSGVARHSITCA